MELICLLIWILARSVEIVRVVVSFLHKRNDGYLICGLIITPFGNIHPDCVVAAGGVGDKQNNRRRYYYYYYFIISCFNQSTFD